MAGGRGGKWRQLDYHCWTSCWPSSPPSFLRETLIWPVTTVFIPLTLAVYVVCGVRHMLRMSQVRIIYGWRYQFLTSSVKPLASWEWIFPAFLKPWFQEFSEGDHSTRQISDCSTSWSLAESIIVDVLHNDGGDLLGLHGDHGRESGSTSRIWWTMAKLFTCINSVWG